METIILTWGERLFGVITIIVIGFAFLIMFKGVKENSQEKR